MGQGALRGLVAMLSALLSTAAASQSQPPLHVDVYATTNQIECDATDVSFSTTDPAWLTWTCVSGFRYRCRLTTSAIYGVGINYVVANCTDLHTPPPDDVFLNGFES